MIHSNKMIYQQPKFTHFLQLHTSIANNNSNNSSVDNSNRRASDDLQSDERSKLDIHDQNSNTSNTSLEVVNDSVGKSFTIAAILGLKKSAVNQFGLPSRQSCDLDENLSTLNDYSADFPSIINLTTHSKLFQKFDNDNRHNNYMLSSTQQSSEHSQMPIEQCIYDSSTTTSFNQEHLHKQHINSEFNANYNRNVESQHSSNPAFRSHIHSHANTNLLNKSFNRDRGRVDHFSNKTKSSLSLKNKRVRTIFTPEQLERLEAEFERQQYMVGPERLYLAHTLQLTEAQVKVWFQNRRIKWRKHHLEITQQHLAIARQRQIPLNVPPSTSKEDSEIVSDGDD